MDIAERTALVTGGSGVVGSAIVERLAAAGADVTVGYHSDRDGAEAAVEAARDHGVEARAVRADLTDEDEAAELVDRADADDDLGVVIAAAGVTEPVPIEDLTAEHLERVLSINLTGTANVLRPAVDRLRSNGRGCDGGAGAVVAVSSVAAEIGSVDASYATAKGGLQGFVRAIARECGADGIRANVVAPGPVDSPMNDAIVEYLEDRRFRGHETVDTLLDRYEATPAEVAEAAVFLARHDFVTGETLRVDGGMSL